MERVLPKPRAGVRLLTDQRPLLRILLPLRSISRKQLVALTGGLLILYVFFHLAGNLLILLGPRMYNQFALGLAQFGWVLHAVEFLLFLVFFYHVVNTLVLFFENRRARGRGYALFVPVGDRSLATKLMPWTGFALLAYLTYHIIDFAFPDPDGPRSFIDGINYELYGLVFNSFLRPVHVTLYLLGVGALGIHLAHGFRSVFQTFGFNHPRYTPIIRVISLLIAIFVTLTFWYIPLSIISGLTKPD